MLLARFHFRAGRQHAGRRMAGALPGLLALEYGNPRTALREAPCDRQPDDAGADDGDTRRCDVRHRLFPPLALPRQVQWV
jgi:hypothetical protein